LDERGSILQDSLSNHGESRFETVCNTSTLLWLDLVIATQSLVLPTRSEVQSTESINADVGFPGLEINNIRSGLIARHIAFGRGR